MEKIESDHRDKIIRAVMPIYNDAVMRYNNGDYDLARDGFIEVEQLLPGYKETGKYLARIDKDIQRNLVSDMQDKLAIKKPLISREVPSMAQDKDGGDEIVELPDIDQEALEYYKVNNFVEAKLKFIEVESISPGYKETTGYLKRIDGDIASRHETAKLDDQNKARTQSTRSPKTNVIDTH